MRTHALTQEVPTRNGNDHLKRNNEHYHPERKNNLASGREPSQNHSPEYHPQRQKQ